MILFLKCTVKMGSFILIKSWQSSAEVKYEIFENLRMRRWDGNGAGTAIFFRMHGSQWGHLQHLSLGLTHSPTATLGAVDDAGAIDVSCKRTLKVLTLNVTFLCWKSFWSMCTQVYMYIYVWAKKKQYIYAVSSHPFSFLILNTTCISRLTFINVSQKTQMSVWCRFIYRA